MLPSFMRPGSSWTACWYDLLKSSKTQWWARTVFQQQQYPSSRSDALVENTWMRCAGGGGGCDGGRGRDSGRWCVAGRRLPGQVRCARRCSRGRSLRHDAGRDVTSRTSSIFMFVDLCLFSLKYDTIRYNCIMSMPLAACQQTSFTFLLAKMFHLYKIYSNRFSVVSWRRKHDNL